MARAAVAAAAIALALAAAPPAFADDRVRVSGACGKGASSTLELKADDRAIEVRFELRHRRAGAAWSLAVVHERRVVWRGTRRMRSGGSLGLRRSVPNFDGADAVTVRALGPRGVTCVASATLKG
jgi:hypothetical protein